MRTVGIKLADGSFYPVLKEGTTDEVVLNLTTANNNQTKVMVDLYRSKTDSMDDAEYVDSLQIENLNEHPNGEPNITFSVYLDENNELHAKMVDSETGAQSNSTITLVSRTLEERLVPADDTITGAEINTTDETFEMPLDETTAGDSFDMPAAETTADDSFTDPAAEALTADSFAEPLSETTAGETFEMPADETPTDNSFSEPLAETPANDAFDIPADIETAPAEEPIFEETAVATDEVEAPENDFNLGDPTAQLDTATAFAEPAAETPADDSFEMPLDETPAGDSFDMPAAETPADDSFTDPAAEALTADSFAEPLTETPADDADIEHIKSPSVASQFVEDDLTSFGGEASHETQSDLENFFGTIDDSDAPADDSFDMPTAETPADDSFDMPATETPVDDSFDMPAAETPADDSFDMPATETPVDDSFDMPEPDATIEDNFDMPLEETTPDFGEMPDFGDISEDLDAQNAGLDDNTDIGGLDFDAPVESTGSSEHDDFFGIGDDDVAPSAGGISFTGLYDKETDFDDVDDDDRKKTKAPVIICVVCAIICLIAVALLLFVLPTKYNLIANGTIKQKQKTEKVAEAPIPVVETTPAVEVEQIPDAKENEVIIIEKAEEVVPLPPPVAKDVPSDIQYRIKWGDTLWDISDTYYKNPWRYKFLANYNNIKNPDYIISGTIITIPAE